MMLTEKVSLFISEKKLIAPNDKIIAAVSGGRDSVSLLHILISIREKFKFHLSAVHINHGIRGAESDKDEQFVIDLCSSLKISCSTFKLNSFTSDTGENALRKARYRIFETEISKMKYSKIATAHHLNDQLETYLMRLFKGSGVKGMLGIPYYRAGFIRPMLQCTRDEINIYCRQNSIRYRDDLSNNIIDKLRNNIRHNFVPQLQDIFENEFLSQFQRSHQDFIDLYNENYKSNLLFFETISEKVNGSVKVTTKNFQSMSFLKKRQFLEYCIYYVCGLNLAIGREQLFEFESFVMSSQTGSKFLFPVDVEVLKNRDDINFGKKQDVHFEVKELLKDSVVLFGDLKISIAQADSKEEKFNLNPNEEIICGDNLSFPLKVRSWQSGDFFYPLGQKTKQKISDFFINNKISNDRKNKIPLLLNNDEIVWIAGYRLSDKYKTVKGAKTIYKLEIV